MSDPDVYRRLAALEKWRNQMASVEVPRFIGARYTSDAGQSFVNNTPAIVDFEDVAYDPLGLVTTGASWVFTCPANGYYNVDAAILFASYTGWAPTEPAQIDLYYNGAQYSVLDRVDYLPAGVAVLARCAGNDTISCSTGDTLQIVAVQVSGATLALLAAAVHNHVSIVRIG